jgi:hypothetical protein
MRAFSKAPLSRELDVETPPEKLHCFEETPSFVVPPERDTHRLWSIDEGCNR